MDEIEWIHKPDWSLFHAQNVPLLLQVVPSEKYGLFGLLPFTFIRLYFRPSAFVETIQFWCYSLSEVFSRIVVLAALVKKHDLIDISSF